MATYTAGCSKVGSFSYAQYFTLYVILSERNIDSASNTSIVDYNVYCQSSGSGSINAKHFLYFNLGGNVFRNETVQVNVSSPNAYIGIASGSLTVTHDSTGNYTLGVSAQIKASSYGVSASINDNFVCATIPRYANFTAHSIAARTETSVTVNWNADAACDYAQYSLNGGSWRDAGGLTYTVGGLTHGTNYTIKTRIRRTDSQLWTESGTLSFSTYYYPHCTNSPNFVIGNQVTLTIYNPLGRSIQIYMVGANGTTQGGDTITGTSISGYNNANWKDWWYSTVPNSNRGTYQVLVKYGSVTMTRSNAGTYDVTNSNPTFASTQWNYEDTNSKVLDLTGNNQILVKNYSIVRGVITSANKATAKNYATMSKYQLAIGGQTPKESGYSSSSTVYVGNLTANSNVLSMYAIDSRGNSTLAQRTVSSSNYKEYFDISIDTSKSKATRKDKVGSETILNVEGKIWNASFGKVANSINTFTVEYKKTNQTDEHYKLLDVTKPTLNGNTFKLNTSIKGDLEADGFTVTESFNIRVKITDALSPSTYVMTLESGTPNLAVHKNGVAINKPYDTNDSASLQVKGTTKTDTLITSGLITNRTFLYWLDAQGSSDNNGRCYRIANLPLTSDANAAVLNIKGSIGGWGVEKATIDVQITNRNGLAVYLNYMGNIKAFDTQQLVVYQESDGSHTVYIKNLAPYTGPLTLEVKCGSYYSQKATIYTDYSYTKSPTGTLAYASVKQSIQNANGGTVLYDNASGTNGTVTLSESAANFSYLEIYFWQNEDNHMDIRKVTNHNGKKFNMYQNNYNSSQARMYMTNKIYSISGTSISVSSASRITWIGFNSDGSYNHTGRIDAYDNMRIVKVVGYR